MAKPKGMISLKGTISGINFYYLNGKAVARASGGGFNGELIKTSPKMERVRENSGEFGMVSKAKKLVRLGLYPFLVDYADVTLHGRMMRLFQEIKVLDSTSERGQRTFQNGLATAEGKALLQHFDFTAQKASTMLPGKGEFNVGTQQYIITDIKTDTLLLPQGATGMQLCFGILQVDFAGGTFKFGSSPTLFIDADFSDTTITLTPDALPDGDGVRIAVLQVRYYQEVNETRFLLKDLGMCGLEVVGVW